MPGEVREGHRNTLYLLSAVSMIFMTLTLAVQPLYLSEQLGLGRENAGFVNANIQVLTEILDLLFIGYLGYLSDRFGRTPLIVVGFLVSAVTATMAAFSVELGEIVGIGGLAFFYVTRAVSSLGATAVLPQLATLSGDFSNREERPTLVANTGFMMAFGATLVYAVLMQIPQEVGVLSVMLLTGAVALVGAWLAKNFLVDVAPRLAGNPSVSARRQGAGAMRRLLVMVKREKGLVLSFATAFISRNDMVLVGLFLMTWSIYFAELLGMEPVQAASRAGLTIGFIGLVVLVSIPIWGRIIARIGRVPAIVLGLALSGLGFCGIGLIVNPFGVWMLLPSLLLGFGQAGALLAPQVLTMDLAPEEMRGTVLGAFNTVGCLGVILFLQAGGLLFDWFGPHMPFVLLGIANLLLMAYGLAIMNEASAEDSPQTAKVGANIEDF
ncbi:MAG: MFS transporter [Magnetococcales bacterium]|nr:MFS transporter [Magnetococcales bacterium]NGZ26839.1 MFS transporter [Magnetococcales bacterium]